MCSFAYAFLPSYLPLSGITSGMGGADTTLSDWGEGGGGVVPLLNPKAALAALTSTIVSKVMTPPIVQQVAGNEEIGEEEKEKGEEEEEEDFSEFNLPPPAVPGGETETGRKMRRAGEESKSLAEMTTDTQPKELLTNLHHALALNDLTSCQVVASSCSQPCILSLPSPPSLPASFPLALNCPTTTFPFLSLPLLRSWALSLS